MEASSARRTAADHGGTSLRLVGLRKPVRDVEATDRDHAVVLAGRFASRIYRTADGGATWRWSSKIPTRLLLQLHGVLRRPRRPRDERTPSCAGPHARTDDGGRSWHILADGGMPDALCRRVRPGHRQVTADGRQEKPGSALPRQRGRQPRVPHHRRGRTWSVAATTLPGGDVGVSGRCRSGIAFTGIAVGGFPPAAAEDVGPGGCHIDGGRSWSSRRLADRCPQRRRLGATHGRTT